MKAKPNEMQAEQQEQPVKNLPAHTKARAAAVSDKRQRIGTKMQAALKAIVWEGKDFPDAAHAAGLKGHAVRCALAKPHVQRFLKQERQVFIDHIRAQNIHHAKRLRECGNAMAELGAVKVIEQIGNEPQAVAGRATTPGLVIVVGIEKTLNLQSRPLETLDLQANVKDGTPLLRGFEPDREAE